MRKIIFDALYALSEKEKIDIAKQIRIDPTNPIVLPAGVELNFFQANPATDGEKRFEKALERKGYVNINKCPYCGNTSQERDKRGNCISCGGAR